jgi:hypothetical protein
MPVVFVLIAVIIVPFGTAFSGRAFTISNHFGTHYWVEWRNLGIARRSRRSCWSTFAGRQPFVAQRRQSERRT